MKTIEEFIQAMTLEEKAGLCTGASAWTTTAIERLGLPALTVSDGPHGVRRVANENEMVAESLPATCFPTASCMASTWDVDLIHELGEALAEECIALGVDVVLGPGVNMKRTPLGGRNFEYYSEDPYLAGEMAASFINGVQSKGVGTSLKHFAGNNQEYQRMVISSEIDERTLHEIYLPAFETAVKQAKPWTVMCAYNQLNGVYCAENYRLLVEILKNDWGFEGFVVSDWGAVHDRVASLAGGLDLEMPGPRERRVKAVVEAVQTGKLAESVLNDAVRRILRIILKASQTAKGGSFDIAAHHALARRVAAAGMVLLKNNGVLPLKTPGKIAVIGLAAEKAHFQGGGSSHINPTRVDQPLAELEKLAGGAQIRFAEGYSEDACFHQDLIDEAVENARSADVAILYIALPPSKESEGYDRPDLELTRQQVALIQAVGAVQQNMVLVLNNGAPVVMGAWMDFPAAILEAWMMGQAGGGAIADILFGKVNPSGRLAETFPLRLEDTPAYINFPGENGQVRYGEGLYIGYRYYDARQAAVQYPFGFGLSYTTFAYSQMSVSAETFQDIDGLVVSVDVTNTGQVAGSEVVQLYVHDQKSSLVRPPKELKGFAKVELQPGETKTIQIALDFRSFAYYDPAYQQWITEDGQFDLLVGASEQDIRCMQTVTLRSSMRLPSMLDRRSTLRAWLADPRGKVVCEPVYQQFMAQMVASMGGGAVSERIAMEANDYLMDMPLMDVLYFQDQLLPARPEEIVDGLLTQVRSATE